ncbi:helix-turn-helix domain-containing protein [Kocuria sp. U4B]
MGETWAHPPDGVHGHHCPGRHGPDRAGERTGADHPLGGQAPSRRQGPRWRRLTFTDSSIRNALRLVDAGEPATQVARNLAMSRATLYRRIRERPSATTI